MEVFKKSRFLLSAVILVTLSSQLYASETDVGKTLGTVTKTVETAGDYWNQAKNIWQGCKIGATVALGAIGYATLAKISKRPILSMVATTGISVLLAHYWTNSNLQRELRRIETKVENNGNLIEQARDFLNEKIENIRNFFNERFNEQDNKLDKIEQDIQQIKTNTNLLVQSQNS